MGGVGEKRGNRMKCRDLGWISGRLLWTLASRGKILELMALEESYAGRFYKVGGQVWWRWWFVHG